VDREKEAAPQRAQRLQEELVAFYCRHQPALIPTAATALASSPLEELLLSLHERFGEIPNEWDIEMRRGQLVAFYGAKDPSRLKTVDFMMRNYKLRDIARSLKQKYKELPDGWDRRLPGEQWA
jgi:hypothetical protein